MPTYELKCGACGKASEVFFMRTLRDEDKVCPECGSTDVKQGVGGGYFNKPTGLGDSAPSCAETGVCAHTGRSAFS